MPATSCPGYEIEEDTPTILMEESLSRDYLQRKYDDARKHRISPKWSFTEVIEKLPIEPTPNKRPIPSFALEGGQYRFRPVWAPKPASFTGPESFQRSQVWVANVSTANDNATTQPERVILKILQPSMRPFPKLTRDGEFRRETAAYQLAYAEEILYKQLRPLQGSHIPYYFGTFLVTLPNGEDAYILILEYIEGEVLQEWVERYDTNETRARELFPVMFHSLIDGFRAMHGVGVVHADMTRDLTNIIALPDGTVVIIDFAESAILETPAETDALVRASSRGSDNQGYRCVRFLLHCCLDEAGGPARARLEDWIGTPGNVPAEVMFPNGPPEEIEVSEVDDDDDDDDSSFYTSGTDTEEH